MGNNLYIDIDKLPSEAKDQIIEIARSHNGLADHMIMTSQSTDKSLALLKEDIENISGATPEDKQLSSDGMRYLRTMVSFVKEHKIDASILTVIGWMLIQIAHGLGVNTQAIGPLVAHWLHLQ